MKYLSIIVLIMALGGCVSTNVHDPLRSPCACEGEKKTKAIKVS